MSLTGAIAIAAATPRLPALDVERLLDLLDGGDYAQVKRELQAVEDVTVLDRIDEHLLDRANDWVGRSDISGRRRRSFVAGALAAELTHTLIARETWLTGNRRDNRAIFPKALPRLSYGLAQQMGSGSTDELDRVWTLACMATWQSWAITAEGHGGWDRQYALGWAYLAGTRDMIAFTPVIDHFAGGFLSDALRRFPADPRLALAAVEAKEAIETRCPAGFCHDEMTPANLDDLRRRASVVPPDGPREWMLQRGHQFSIANLAAFDRLLPVAAAFAAVAGRHPPVRAEASVHIGYLAIRAARPDAALAPLATATTSDDPHVRHQPLRPRARPRARI